MGAGSNAFLEQKETCQLLGVNQNEQTHCGGVARRYQAGQVQGINHFRVFLIGVAVEASSAN